jgi:23S rRNA pseudouridine1911/1915/1917 synthase
VVSARRLEVAVDAAEVGERIDRALAAHLASEGLSRSVLARMCDEGRVTLAGAPVRAAARVRGGEVFTVDVPPPEPARAEPEAIPLTVVFEDAHLLVVDKPAGLVVHPSKGHATGTLVNAVLHHATVEDDDTADPLRPGIVHRIDRDTSGLLVVARSPTARAGLEALFRAHDIERRYVALVEGEAPAAVTYDTPYGRHPRDRMKFTGRVASARRAVTHVARTALLAGGAASLVACTLETGRTHQIRVHLSEAGLPLLGDAMYGRTPRTPALRPIAAALGRQALHAAVLGFVHPVTGAPLRFESPLPDDFARALRALEALGASGQ